MPWNQGGGGPWGGGGGGQNPWGQRGGQQPNIEELIRKGQERMKRIMPGGVGPNLLLIAIVVAALALWLASGIYTVRPGEVGLVLRFGALDRQTTPGLRWHLPAPIESVINVDVQQVYAIEVPGRTPADLRTARVPPSVTMLTGDENIIEFQYVIQYQVADAALYTFNVQHQNEVLIRQVADSALREVVSQTTAQRALTEGRAEMAEETQRLTQRVLDNYRAGVRITDIQLRSVEPPQRVIAAFRDVQAAKADRERARNEAEAYRNDIVPRARGEAQSVLFAAEAYRQGLVARAQGEASRFQQVLEAYRAAPDVTTQRLYLETMEEILRGTGKVIVDQGAGGPGVIPYLPLPGLRPAPGQPGGATTPTPNVGSTGGRQ
jgi:membrane protease subunit HflK